MLPNFSVLRGNNPRCQPEKRQLVRSEMSDPGQFLSLFQGRQDVETAVDLTRPAGDSHANITDKT